MPTAPAPTAPTFEEPNRRMEEISFSSDWLRLLSDPFAVLGLSVTADDRWVLKRYRSVAKLLHPDQQADSSPALRETSEQLFARLINPAYEKLKQDKVRKDSLVMLRYKARRLNVQELKSAIARKLVGMPVAEVEIFYEQTVAKLAEEQYHSLERLETITDQLTELNLVYLRLKSGEPFIRPKPKEEIIPRSSKEPPIAPPSVAVAEPPTVNYAQRHYERGLEYARKGNLNTAVRELKDAISLEPKRSDYHALLGEVYFLQNLPGMAKVHFKQALKLNPKEPRALKYVTKLQIQLDNPPASNQVDKTNKLNKQSLEKGGTTPNNGGLFGLFARKR